MRRFLLGGAGVSPVPPGILPGGTGMRATSKFPAEFTSPAVLPFRPARRRTGRAGRPRHRCEDAVGRRTLFRYLVAILISVALSGCSKAAPPPQKSGPVQLVVPEQGAYTGAYMDFGDQEDTVTLEAIESFEKLIGKKQAIVASSSYWGEQTFPTANVNLIWRHGAIPMIYWSPWDKPYEEDKGPDKFSLTAILAGKWDGYIDKWADSAHTFGKPFFVSFCNEMNGSWFPWSGNFYGGGKEIPKTDPPRYEGPETCKKAYRYVVDRVRARGATNIIWVLHLMNFSIPQDSWNVAAEYYPGPEYVDWFGLSVYGEQYQEEHWSFFSERMIAGKMTGGLLDWPYKELCELDPHKPIMLAEWGVGEFPKNGSKAEFIAEAFAEMKTRPRLKAAIFWHERWENEENYYSNLHVNSSPRALEAYRKGVADSFWLDRPVFSVIPSAVEGSRGASGK